MKYNPLRILGLTILKILGWKVQENPKPWPNKCVIVVAPHTSNWDYFYTFFLRWVIPIRVNYLAKKELFIFPIGWFFRATGGAPIERRENRNQVESIIDLFESKTIFRLALSPEGTRKKADWRSGFYHIALGAQLPVRMLRVDYKSRTLTFSEDIHFTGDKVMDYKVIQDFYAKAEPKYPESFENIKS